MLCSAVRYSIRIPLGIEEEEEEEEEISGWPRFIDDNNRLFKMQVYDTEYTRPTTRF